MMPDVGIGFISLADTGEVIAVIISCEIAETYEPYYVATVKTRKDFEVTEIMNRHLNDLQKWGRNKNPFFRWASCGKCCTCCVAIPIERYYHDAPSNLQPSRCHNVRQRPSTYG